MLETNKCINIENNLIYQVTYTPPFGDYFSNLWVTNCFHLSITIHKKRCTRHLTNHCVPRCARAGHTHTPCRYHFDVTPNYLRHYMQDHFFLKTE